jgi:hypothetical protein
MAGVGLNREAKHKKTEFIQLLLVPLHEWHQQGLQAAVEIGVTSLPSSLIEPVPEATYTISSLPLCVCSRMKQPGATVFALKENSIEPWTALFFNMFLTNPLTGTGCQKVSPSVGPITLVSPAVSVIPTMSQFHSSVQQST